MSSEIIYPYYISLYQTCPRQYYYHTRGYPGIVTATPPQLQYGAEVHELISYYYKELSVRLSKGESVSPEELINTIIRRVGFIVEGRSKVVLKNFLKFEEGRWEWSDNPIPIAVEERFIKEPFGGVVDLLTRRGDDVVVVDWKTGSYPGYLAEEYILQGSIYLYITGAKSAIFYFLSSGGMEEITEIDDGIFEIAERILGDKVYPMVKGSHCVECPYQLPCNLHRVGYNWRKLVLGELI